ncbi:MAG: hypothetical protein KJ065_18710 [Anaerolineae bacterium]|nr:hypothetical protein [Anaerolineae bacterium]
MRRAPKLLGIAGLILLGLILLFLLYARLADEMETSSVEEAVRRDCQMEIEVSADDLRKPGMVFKHYVRDGRTVELICQGPNWGCECDQ